MKRLFLLLLVCSLVFSQTAFAANYLWRYRTHETDCTALTDGKVTDLCYEQDSQSFYKCVPDAGNCSGSEWKVIAGTAANPAGSAGDVQYYSSGVFGAEAAFNYNAVANQILVQGGLKVGAGSDADVTAIIVDRASTDATFGWDETNDQWISNYPISAQGSGHSTITQGLFVNEGGGGTSEDVFRVEGDTDVNLIYSDVVNDRVGIGTSSPQVKLNVNGGIMGTPPSAQTIAGGNTVAADACGSIKPITSSGNVTTNTTNTFTAPATANTGCCMDVVNVGSDIITLDNNTNFVSVGAGDAALGAGDAARVCSNGTKWYQISGSNN